MKDIKAKDWPKQKPITLDSRYRMLEYSGITAATPNEPEVEEALGIKVGDGNQRLFTAGEQLMKRMGLQSAGDHSRPRRHGGVREECQATG